MKLFGTRYNVDWGHFLTLNAILVATLWYLFDARSVSLSINNLIVVQPTALIVVVLYLVIVRECFTPVDGATPKTAEEPDGTEEVDNSLWWRDRQVFKVIGLAAALIVYSLAYETVGLDVATLAFLFVAMFICGERRIVALVLFPVLATILLVYAAHFLVLVPVPGTFI